MRKFTRAALVLGSSAALVLGTAAAAPAARPVDNGGVLGAILGGTGDRVGDRDGNDWDENESRWTEELKRWQDDDRWDRDRWDRDRDDRDDRDRDFRWHNDDSDSDDGASVLELGGIQLITVTEGIEILNLDLGDEDLEDRRWNDRDGWKHDDDDDDRDGLLGGLLG